jgi:NNP family nitrate/nitrite transporter-like MFS transporter
VNAGLGNLGVSAAQFLAPLVVAAGVYGPLAGGPQTLLRNGVPMQIFAQNAAFVWVPFIVLATIAAWIGMNDIAEAKASLRAQAVIFSRKHTWIMSWLYLGTFGSFIGYSAGFPLLIKNQFPEVSALAYAWMGPLIGAVVRPFGGWLADKLGGAVVTFWNFVVMAAAVGGVLYFLDRHSFAGFFACFMVLFFTTGIGNGSTFRMIPVIFPAKEASPVLGFTAALAAYGGFFIPKSYGSSIELTGGPQAALYIFIVFYLTCIALTWWYYSRRNAPMPC